VVFNGWDKEKIDLADNTPAQAICPVIVSASRATDIPAFFAEWFRNRLEAGYLLWINPFNAKQSQYVSFRKARVIVFWSKNPKPLIQYLPEIDAKGIHYYFQFTLNDYEPEGLEQNVPSLTQRVETFKTLSERLGKKRVIWRYDPLILTDNLTIDSLVDRIAGVAGQIKGYTEKLIISFADINIYKKVQNNLARERVNYREFTPSLMLELAERLQRCNQEWGLKIATCAEGIELDRYGIEHNRCIDDHLMIELFNDDSALMGFLGYQPDLFANHSRPYLKDKGQRKACGCIVSKDVGMYDTCHHLCTYCYANTSCKAVENNLGKHNPEAEALVSKDRSVAC
jgi:DNA repair photolyase